MCECGCADFSPYRSYKVGKNILVLEIYPGCENCDNPLGITLAIFTPSEAKHWLTEPSPEFKPDQYGSKELYFSLIGKDDLIQAAKDIVAENGDPIEDEGYANLVDWLEDDGLDLLQRALRIRLEKEEKTKEGSEHE